MVTAADIEQQLIRAAKTSDIDTIVTIVTALTPKQAAHIDPSVFGQVLNCFRQRNLAQTENRLN